jgi:hypothetical protein
MCVVLRSSCRKVVHLSVTDLQGWQIVEACSDEGVRQAARDRINQAFDQKQAQLAGLRAEVLEGLPRAQNISLCKEVLMMQTEGKRDVVDNRVSEGYFKMWQSCLKLREVY